MKKIQSQFNVSVNGLIVIGLIALVLALGCVDDDSSGGSSFKLPETPNPVDTSYTLSFNSNGGGSVPPAMTAKAGTYLNIPEAPPVWDFHDFI